MSPINGLKRIEEAPSCHKYFVPPALKPNWDLPRFPSALPHNAHTRSDTATIRPHALNNSSSAPFQSRVAAKYL